MSHLERIACGHIMCVACMWRVTVVLCVAFMRSVLSVRACAGCGMCSMCGCVVHLWGVLYVYGMCSVYAGVLSVTVVCCVCSMWIETMLCV